jgi:hypothetical protein
MFYAMALALDNGALVPGFQLQLVSSSLRTDYTQQYRGRENYTSHLYIWFSYQV